jgi:GNAT superfamily N-acetyltransferase
MIEIRRHKGGMLSLVPPCSSERRHLQRWIDDCDQPPEDYEAVCFVENGVVHGFACIRRAEFDPLGEQVDPWLIELVYVVPSHRRRGIGKKLMEYTKQLHGELTLFCTTIAGRKLYDSTGFDSLDLSGYPGVDMMRYP